MIAIRTTRGVWLAAALTTLVATIVAEALTLAVYPIGSGSSAYISTPIITCLTAFPISFFCWSVMRQNSNLTDELQRLLNRDRLTDAATRDFFFARMEVAPGAYGVSLMVDIDHFKQINDTHGHLAGDRVIARVAQVLRSCVGKEDIVCRFGGEEFVIFLQGHDRADGLAAAERMRLAVEARQLRIADMDVRVTVSVGGSLKEAEDSITVSIQEADAALYRAKALGRNRTVFAPLPGRAAVSA